MTQQPSMTQQSNGIFYANGAALGSAPPSLSRDEAVTAVAATAVARAQGLTEQVRRLAGDMADKARGTAKKQLSEGKDYVGEGLAQLAAALRMTASHLRERHDTELSDRVARAAARLEVVSSYLQKRTLGGLLGDVAEFARRKPPVFLADAFRVGLLTAEFMSARRGSNGGDDPGPGASSVESSEASADSPEPESRRERTSRPMWSDGPKTTPAFR